MACQIFRNSDGSIDRVENNRGETSQLYSEALKLMNSEQALEVAQVPYTSTYLEINGETASEPALKDVLTFMSRHNNQNKSLSKQDLDELRNNTLSSEFSTIEELYSAIQPLYLNGVFTISETTLKKTGLYSELEIGTILNDSVAQNRIKTVADRIAAEVSLNNSDLSQVNSNLALYESPELVEVQDTSSLVGLGKFLQLNPFLIDKQLREKVGGIKNREQFESSLDQVNEAITDRYFSNAEYANSLFEAYSSMQRMTVLEDSEEGLSPTVKNDIKKFTEQALIIGQDSGALLQTIDLLQSAPRDIWANSGVEIEDLLLRVEDYCAELGIDVIGISTKEYTYEEGQEFLNSLGNLAARASNGIVNSEDIQYFTDNYNFIFPDASTPIVTAEKVAAKNNGKSLVKISSIKSEQELFDQNNLIKVDNNGTYQRVNRQQDLEGFYDYVTDLVKFNPNIIEKSALYPSAYTNKGEFSLSLAKSEDIRPDIERYVKQQPFSEELTLYKIAFSQPLTFKTQEIAKPQNVEVDYDFLTGDFISNFAKEYLKEKIENSELFNKLYNHFSFTNADITLKDNDPYSKQEIRLFTPQTHSLRKYAAISKNADLNTLFPNNNEDVVSDRDFYLNYPEQLAKKTIQYEVSENGDYLATENLQDNFINVKDEIWEKARTYKNMTIYQKLPSLNNPYYFQKSKNTSINNKVDVKQFEGLVKTLENITQIEKVYTTKELASINEERECR